MGPSSALLELVASTPAFPDIDAHPMRPPLHIHVTGDRRPGTPGRCRHGTEACQVCKSPQPPLCSHRVIASNSRTIPAGAVRTVDRHSAGHRIARAFCCASHLPVPSNVSHWFCPADGRGGRVRLGWLTGDAVSAKHRAHRSVLTPPAEAVVIPLPASAHFFRHPLDKRHYYWHSVRYDHSGYQVGSLARTKPVGARPRLAR
jgi:hypothetical protein